MGNDKYRSGKKRLNLWLDAEDVAYLESICALSGMSVTAICSAILKDFRLSDKSTALMKAAQSINEIFPGGVKGD